MKTLPNGITIFNATPHVVRFWSEGWEKPVEVETDEIVSASVEEEVVKVMDFPPAIDNMNQRDLEQGTERITYVRTVFGPTAEGAEIISRAAEGADLIIVGSIIAAQAYPGRVVAMTPAPGYERVPPAEKRMNPHKFTVFGVRDGE
jgi:hypothetical protein